MAGNVKCNDELNKLLQWFYKHIERKYGQIGFIVTKHDGYICKVEKIDREHIDKN